MKNLEIIVPKTIMFLSQWQELLNILPNQGKYILNKVNTGCGGTTLFLESNRPTILVSPRSNVLYSKSAQFPNAHLFRKKTDSSTSVLTLKDRLRDYINYTLQPLNGMHPTIIPKILVTIDSYPYVAEQLEYMGVLKHFSVLVDEFQCILSDSKFKAKEEFEFLHNLRDVKSICYMSATPIDESYLDNMPAFSDVSCYYKLVWDPMRLETPNLDMRPYKEKQSSKSICRDIIADYRENGYFATKIINDTRVFSKEVVFFLNEVKTICQIIRENSLDPNEVNVLCSLSNRYVKDLNSLGVHIGELATDRNNPVNRIFTFATRASFEGVDFYSNSAFTYIFCDGMLDWNRNDLIIDVPQILGRQRLASNPFWKDAVLYYRADSRRDSLAAQAKIMRKEKATRQWIGKYNSCDQQTKLMLKDGIDKRSDQSRYADDYVEFVDDKNGGFLVKENYLVKCTEIRDWQLSTFVYNNPLSIVKAIADETSINVTSGIGYNSQSGSTALDKFVHDFFKSKTFPEKMRIYAEMRMQHPECTNDLYQNTFIDYRFHQCYNILGANRLRALCYRKKDIMDAASQELQFKCIAEKCKSAFPPGNYRIPDIKATLQKIYDDIGYRAIAKAKDIAKYIPSANLRQLTTLDSGKRELYYEIC